MTDELGVSSGLILWMLLSFLGVALIPLTRNHYSVARAQVRLFLVAFAVRFAVSVLIYSTGLVNVLGDADSSGWVRGAVLSDSWAGRDFGLTDLPGQWLGAYDTKNDGYLYLLATLFFVTGASGRLAAAALNCFFGAMTVVVASRVARVLISDQAGARAGALVCFFPSMVIWSAQTLKEPVVILLETVALYGCTLLKLRGVTVRHLALCALAIPTLIPFRFYAAYIATAAFILSLTLPNFRRRDTSIGSAALVLLIIPSTLYFTGIVEKDQEKYENLASLEFIKGYRTDMASGEVGASGVELHFDLHSPVGFLSAAVVGGAHLILAPFPWQLGGGSLRLLLTLPELLFWWFLFASAVLPGLLHALKDSLRGISPLLFFLFGLGLAYGVTFGNVGLAYRQRAQLLPMLFIFAVYEFDRRRLRRPAPPLKGRRDLDPAPPPPP